ncbi:MAG: NADPH-dependent F420 reductase [Candidatus Limnocylindrales bacterium]
MNVAIIGAGNVGRALAASFTRTGHIVTFASRDPEHAAAAAAATGARFAKTNAEAAAAGQVVVLAIPFASVEAVAEEIRDAVAGKPVVDATNRMSFGPSGPTIDNGDSNADRLAAWLPNAHVVKAFNTLFASHQLDPTADGIQLDGFVAGDDQGAKDTVLELVRSIGLNPVDVGPLARAQQLEQIAFLNIALNVTANGSWSSGWRLVGAPTLAPVAA